jgi:hypothetical protein
MSKCKGEATMNIRISGAIFVVAAVSALAACASKSPANPPSAAATSSQETYGGYRRVMRNGEEYFCKRENFTGSRTQVIEKCLTKAQMTAQRETAQSLLRNVQNGPGDAPQPDPNGAYPGVNNPVMPH